jgi:3',5'-cyclic AMP phosphodiesterase CpdA
MRRLYILIALMICSVTLSSAQLRFNHSGKLKIVQFTDAHVRTDREDMLQRTVERLEWVIATQKPDVVIFTGDVVSGGNAAKGWRAILDPVAKSNTPAIVLLGNHDLEGNISATELATLITSYPNTLNTATSGVLDDKAIEVLASDSDDVAALLYCLDTNSYSTIEGVEGYGWLKHSQVAWYRSVSSSYSEAYGAPLPAYMFLHIPLPEYREAATTNANELVGVRNEEECSPKLNSGMFLAIKEMGDVVATFAGHDHNNNYIVPHYGVALCYGHFSGDNTVYNSLYSGVRIIELTEGKRDFETWVCDYRQQSRGKAVDHILFKSNKGKIKHLKR